MNFFPKLKRALFADNLPWYVPLRDSEAKEKKIDENFLRHVRQMTQNGVKMTKKGKKQVAQRHHKDSGTLALPI